MNTSTTPILSTATQSLLVQECFGPTIQGEGYWAGTLVDFIRLYGCPVGCPWCDTGYAGGGSHLPCERRTIGELVAALQSPRTVISGGEPFLHAGIVALVEAIGKSGRAVSIETSGAFYQPVADWAWVTLSPKQHLSPRYPVRPEIWQRANEVKIVISTGEEVEYYRPYLLPGVPVSLQPEWEERERTLPLTLSLLRNYPRYRLSVQLHKYIQVP
ncbi:7-carboxy-7-deazaguanine synthase QueE [Gloeobacter kilaueensis]|uniref:7-carboxy-7-deazaguanine synthase n=1 Tax=Gloeobacter kilaueensis (strain ATCC BAA-2537 / CCAP 1431/1 / ULC 316 / JS1) TaxID=1183438 RepID=U5QCB9_GLOK1|nr:7-carboxy-7-deazaguanine synthase QueE [Gloeobacter kilaueensis]AGY56562.1 queuosine biosynthesis protein QueE [Gloeobacter kilaueensis JS1]